MSLFEYKIVIISFEYKIVIPQRNFFKGIIQIRQNKEGIKIKTMKKEKNQNDSA